MASFARFDSPSPTSSTKKNQFVFDPTKDLQEQLRSSLHVKMKNLMRPNLQRSTETSTPSTMVSKATQEQCSCNIV